jgi:hypothetical protein
VEELSLELFTYDSCIGGPGSSGAITSDILKGKEKQLISFSNSNKRGV